MTERNWVFFVETTLAAVKIFIAGWILLTGALCGYLESFYYLGGCAYTAAIVEALVRVACAIYSINAVQSRDRKLLRNHLALSAVCGIGCTIFVLCHYGEWSAMQADHCCVHGSGDLDYRLALVNHTLQNRAYELDMCFHGLKVSTSSNSVQTVLSTIVGTFNLASVMVCVTVLFVHPGSFA